MWYFYGLVPAYTKIVALGEVIPAILINFKKTRFIGSLLYTLVALNIFLINTFFIITIATHILSGVLLIISLIILHSERGKLLNSLK